MKYSEFYKDVIENSIVMGRPVSGFFELTARCNLRCKMCYICSLDDHKSLMDRELTAAQWIELGKQARDAGVLYVTLTGGEIFIRKDFWEIYEAFTQMGFIITLYTNGTLLNDEMVQKLAERPPLVVSISVYGASPDTYEKVTGHAEAYEKTVANIKRLLAAGVKVQLKTTVIKYNSAEYERLAELSKSMGLSMGVVNYISPRRDGDGTDPLANRLEPYELARYEKNADICVKELYKSVLMEKDTELLIDDVMADDNVEAVRRIADLSSVKKTAFRCTAGKCGFWLSWEGKLLPCGLISDMYSEPLKNSFETAWKELRKICASVPPCEECESCSYFSKCMTCPARLKLETGDFQKPAPYICEYTKARDAFFRSD